MCHRRGPDLLEMVSRVLDAPVAGRVGLVQVIGDGPDLGALTVPLARGTYTGFVHFPFRIAYRQLVEQVLDEGMPVGRPALHAAVREIRVARLQGARHAGPG